MIHAFVSDVHVGNHQQGARPPVDGINNRAHLVLDVLKRVQRAGALRSFAQPGLFGEGRNAGEEWEFVSPVWDMLHIAGDLFDTDTPSPQLLAEVAEALWDLACVDGAAPMQRFINLMLGNHDGASARQHALGCFNFHPSVNKVLTFGATARFYGKDGIERPGTVGLIPFQPGPAADYIGKELWRLAHDAPTLADSGHWLPNRPRAIAIHAGIRDGSEPPWLANATDSIALEEIVDLCLKHNIAACFAGNWHSPRVWKRRGVDIVQMGALCPTGWDNAGWDYGGVGFFDDEKGRATLAHIEGPRFITLNDDEEGHEFTDLQQEIEKAAGKVTDLFLRVKTTKKARAEQRASGLRGVEVGGWARHHDSGRGVLPKLHLSFEVEARLLDNKAKASVREEAKRLRGAEDLPELVDEFIASMVYRIPDDPDGPSRLDPQRVRSIVREELGV